MRFLNSALISEGTTDDRFLPRLLSRGLEEICAVEMGDPVDVSEVAALRSRAGPPSITDILDLMGDNPNSFTLISFHRDQGANAERVKREWLVPLRERWEPAFGQLVDVVPVRETEAWMLADGDALRRALGVRWSDRELGVPSPPLRVESVADPKKLLKQLETRLRRPVENYFERLGEEVSLPVLRQVPAFGRWWADTRSALVGAGFPPR